MKKFEHRVNMKFPVKLRKHPPMECIKLLKDVYGNNLMSRSRVFEWHKRFSENPEEDEDD